MGEVHPTAFRHAADAYERGRPGYPAEALDHLTAELGLTADSAVVDLAAGTGKLTRDLTPRFGRVIAVEPLPEMLAILREAAPEAEAIAGKAEALPLPDASVDAVLVAQAFHWFAGSPALEEIARVLRPGGGLGLIWNSTPWEAREGPWFSAVDDLLERSRADLTTLRRHASGEWMKVFDGDTPFGSLSHTTVPNPRQATREEFLAALASRSYVASLPESDQEEVLREVSVLLDRPDAPRDGDAILVPLRTEVFWTRLR